MIKSSEELHYYEVYGLIVRSTLKLVELIEIKDISTIHKIDINIDINEMTKDIKEEIDNGRVRNYEKGYIWFDVKETAIYKIENGIDITIQPYENSKIEDIKLYLLGSCLGIALLEKGKLPIHGGSIEINNNGIIFMGEKGAGKSTLTSALRLRGYNLIADDISVVDNKNGYKIKSGFPTQKLCKDALEKLGYSKGDFDTLIVDDKLKYIIPVEDNFKKEEVPLKGICFLKVRDVRKLSITEVRGKDKLDTLVENIYRIEVLKALGINSKHIKEYVNLLSQIPMYSMIRPRGEFTIDRQIELIEDLFIG